MRGKRSSSRSPRGTLPTGAVPLTRGSRTPLPSTFGRVAIPPPPSTATLPFRNRKLRDGTLCRFRRAFYYLDAKQETSAHMLSLRFTISLVLLGAAFTSAAVFAADTSSGAVHLT